jgi:hypothetical protein
MPFERREILFYLTELKQAVLDSGEVIEGKMPSTGDIQILDALHTRDFHSSFHDIQMRFRSIFAKHGDRAGVMFRVSANGLFRKDQIIGIIVRDSVMERVLIKACKEFNIGLPRAAQKNIVAKDLAIGFEFIFDTAGLMLEDA